MTRLHFRDFATNEHHTWYVRAKNLGGADLSLEKHTEVLLRHDVLLLTWRDLEVLAYLPHDPSLPALIYQPQAKYGTLPLPGLGAHLAIYGKDFDAVAHLLVQNMDAAAWRAADKKVNSEARNLRAE